MVVDVSLVKRCSFQELPQGVTVVDDASAIAVALVYYFDTTTDLSWQFSGLDRLDTGVITTG